ncbi:MAG: glycosyltransferase [Bacteroidia bacterium]
MSLLLSISFLLFTLYVLTLLSLAFAWIASPVFRSREERPSSTISVVIAVRNEVKNIEACLRRIAIQDYPSSLLEVILVDDHSEDSTLAEAQKAFTGYPFTFRILSLDTEEKGKKAALAKGISGATGKLIVTTDGDCTPASKNWLKTIAAFYEKKNALLIIAPVALIRERGFLSAFQSLEFMGLGIITGAAAKLGKAVMCNGANLAFESAVFFEAGAYAGNAHIASGDDVFLMNKIQEKYPGKVHYLKSPEALVLSSPAKTAGEFVQQRLRWAGKFGANRNGFNFYLGILVLTANLLFVVLAALSCFFPQLAKYLVLIASSKWLIDFLLVFLAALSLKQTRVLWWYLPAMLVNPIYVCFTVAAGFLTKPVWKGRKIKR